MTDRLTDVLRGGLTDGLTDRQDFINIASDNCIGSKVCLSYFKGQYIHKELIQITHGQVNQLCD